MSDIHKTVREDWEELARLTREAFTDTIRMAAESSGLIPMTREEFQAIHPNQAIPIPADRVLLLPDIESKISHIRYHELVSIFEGYQRRKAEALVKRLFGLYGKMQHMFQSEFDRVMDNVKRNNMKALAAYLKQAGSLLKQIQNLRHKVKPIPKQVTEPLGTAISNMTESLNYAKAMHDYLQSLPYAPDITSKGTRRKHPTSHQDWNKVITDVVNFFRTQPDVDVFGACQKTAYLLQTVFPATWKGGIDTLARRIQQRHFKSSYPI